MQVQTNAIFIQEIQIWLFTRDEKQFLVLSNEEKLALNKLVDDAVIIICKPDKGQGVVILDKAEYVNNVRYLNQLRKTTIFKI